MRYDVQSRFDKRVGFLQVFPVRIGSSHSAKQCRPGDGNAVILGQALELIEKQVVTNRRLHDAAPRFDRCRDERVELCKIRQAARYREAIVAIVPIESGR